MINWVRVECGDAAFSQTLEMGAVAAVIKQQHCPEDAVRTTITPRHTATFDKRRWHSLLLTSALVLAVAGCELPVQVHGNLPEDEQIAKLEPGQQGRTDIANLLGTPSALSTFQDDTWYYIGVKQTQFAFFDPDIKERNVLVLTFDDQDRLLDKKLYTQADTREVDLVDKVTPTEGRSLTLLQQLLGNIGRFNDQGSDGPLSSDVPRPDRPGG